MILFSAISKGSLILCEYTESNEDFQSLILKQLKFIKNNEEKQQFQINEYTLYHLQKPIQFYVFIATARKQCYRRLENICLLVSLRHCRSILIDDSVLRNRQGPIHQGDCRNYGLIQLKTENHVGQLKQEIQEIQTHQEINTQNMYQEPKGISKKSISVTAFIPVNQSSLLLTYFQLECLLNYLLNLINIYEFVYQVLFIISNSYFNLYVKVQQTVNLQLHIPFITKIQFQSKKTTILFIKY